MTADLADEVRRLRTMIEHRSHAGLYERTAWQHEQGQHEGSALPFASCPRCEMEHPQGRYHQLLDAAARLAELLDEVDQQTGIGGAPQALNAFDRAANGQRLPAQPLDNWNGRKL